MVCNFAISEDNSFAWWTRAVMVKVWLVFIQSIHLHVLLLHEQEKTVWNALTQPSVGVVYLEKALATIDVPRRDEAADWDRPWIGLRYVRQLRISCVEEGLAIIF